MAGGLLLIDVGGVRRRNPDGAGWLLDGVDLQVEAGNRLALAGPSGSGKTLLLRAMALLDRVDEGEILWRGSKVVRESVPEFRRQAIYLHQRPAMIEETVEEALRQPFRLQVHRKRAYARERIVGWLGQLDRDDSLLARPTSELSGGERQIVALLRAVQLDPTVLLLDEPTAALDPASVESIEHIVAEWFEELPEERALVWVSHDEAQAERVTDRTLRMTGGRIV
jgi:putative ABC transport system ATP-binding protein